MSKTTVKDVKSEKRTSQNALDAGLQGANAAVYLNLSVVANLIAILASIAFANAVLEWFGNLAGLEGITFNFLLGKLFIPVAWIIGIPTQVPNAIIRITLFDLFNLIFLALKDLDSIGQVLGINYFVNTITAFDLMKDLSLDPRSVTIATYALCGFTQPMTIGVQIAALGTLAPERKGEVTALAFRAYGAGIMACLLTATIAGTLIE